MTAAKIEAYHLGMFLFLLLLTVVFPNVVAGILLARRNRKTLSSVKLVLFVKLIIVAVYTITAIALSIATGIGLILLSSSACVGVYGNSQSCNFGPIHFLLGISFYLPVITLFQLIAKIAYRR